MTSLEGWSSTIELHPQAIGGQSPAKDRCFISSLGCGINPLCQSPCLTPDAGLGKLLRQMRGWPQRLLQWYARHKRVMPWRGHPDPYAVWVSEIMLQQTRVDTVRPYFARFLQRFPSVSGLADAPMEDLLKTWEGLGYYSRARNLQKAAREIAAAHGGQLPRSAAALEQLPGIGPYTAAAIASICFGERVPVVDGNVARVFSRLLGWRDDFTNPAPRQKLADWIAPQFPRTVHPGDLNQAMMELGALVCTPQTPDCPTCPLRSFCHAKRTGTQDALPVRPARKTIPTRHFVAMAIRRRGRVLLRKRGEAGRLLGGFWELPVEPVSNEMPSPKSVADAMRKQTGLTLRNLSEIGELVHVFTHFRLRLTIFTCKQVSGRLRPGASAALRWADAKELARLPVATAHRRAIEQAGCCVT